MGNQLPAGIKVEKRSTVFRQMKRGDAIRSKFIFRKEDGTKAAAGLVGCLTQVLLRPPVRGVSYTLRPRPWRVVVCVWSVVVLNNSAPSLAVAGWLQDRYCDKFYS